jgi:hypothetical protein
LGPSFWKNVQVERNGRPSSAERSKGPQGPTWPSFVLGLLVSLAIVGPTFLSEETWHGAPLIDRGGLLWIVPSVIMAIGLFIGGTIAGYRRQGLNVALLQGLLIGAVTIGLAFAGDMGRRHLLGQGLQFAVVEYWIGAVAAGVVVGGLGGVTGRYGAHRLWKHRQMDFG